MKLSMHKGLAQENATIRDLHDQMTALRAENARLREACQRVEISQRARVGGEYIDLLFITGDGRFCEAKVNTQGDAWSVGVFSGSVWPGELGEAFEIGPRTIYGQSIKISERVREHFLHSTASYHYEVAALAPREEVGR